VAVLIASLKIAAQKVDLAEFCEFSANDLGSGEQRLIYLRQLADEELLHSISSVWLTQYIPYSVGVGE